jgi:hypothetical protein
MSGNSITGEMGIDNFALSLKWSNVGDLYMPLAEVKFLTLILMLCAEHIGIKKTNHYLYGSRPLSSVHLVNLSANTANKQEKEIERGH